MKWHPFSEVVIDATSKFKKIKASDYKAQGKYRIIDQGKEPVVGYTDDVNLVNDQLLPVLIFGDHTRVLKYEDQPIALGADGAKALWINPDVGIARYVYYYLRSIEIKEAGYSRHFKFLKEIEIPIPFKDNAPDFDEQIRIAYLLSKVEGLIAQRKQHLQQLDVLLKSVFLEMFGDPIRNEKGWEKRPCSKVAEIITGHPFKSDLYADDPTQLRLCGGLIIYPQHIEWAKCNYWPKQLLPGLERYLLETKDIVLAMDRPWISSGLKICTVDEVGHGSLLVQRTARLRAKDVDQYFLYAHLKNSSFTRHCKPTETTVPHISIKDIQTFQVLCPPKQLQTRFASIAEKIERIKSYYQQSLTDVEGLYGALSKQAFKGDLDLSRAPMPGIQPEEEITVATEPLHTPAEQGPALNLPDTDNLLDALESAEARGVLISQWLDAYRDQLGRTPFSVQHFIAAAQTRLAELHPNNDFELGSNDYEHIKAWVFDGLAAGTLVQTFDDAGNRIELKAVQA